jgi:hypothetical protein
MNTPSGWFVSPAEERTALAADLLARESVYAFRAYTDQLAARMALRERMGMIVTIDRSGTARSIAARSVSEDVTHG